jgi:hypothetical protein
MRLTQVDSSLQVFWDKILYAFLISSLHATYPAHFIVLNLITVVEYIWWWVQIMDILVINFFFSLLLLSAS